MTEKADMNHQPIIVEIDRWTKDTDKETMQRYKTNLENRLRIGENRKKENNNSKNGNSWYIQSRI